MSDNILLNQGSGGSTVATDDIGGAHHQLVKVEYGADGSATPVSPVNPLPVRAVGGSSYLNGTTSQQVKGSAGKIIGIFVASSSSGTIKLWDNTSAASTVLVNTFSATAATWYPLPFDFGTGLYITVGGTIDYTVSYT